MPKQISPEREREFSELSAFLDFYATNVEGIDPASPSHPTTVGAEIVREYGKSQALSGLRQAINDVVEDVNDLPPADVEKLDHALAQAGLLTVSEIRRRYASSYRRIVKRGHLRTETEYYLVRGILSDVENGLSPEDRKQIESMARDFENRSPRG